MRKPVEIDAIVGELYSAAQTITDTARSLMALYSQTENTPAQAEDKPAQEPVTMEDVRAVLSEKSRAGHTDKVRELLLKHGAPKLSEINPGHYAALLADVRAING